MWPSLTDELTDVSSCRSYTASDGKKLLARARASGSNGPIDVRILGGAGRVGVWPALVTCCGTVFSLIGSTACPGHRNELSWHGGRLRNGNWRDLRTEANDTVQHTVLYSYLGRCNVQSWKTVATTVGFLPFFFVSRASVAWKLIAKLSM